MIESLYKQISIYNKIALLKCKAQSVKQCYTNIIYTLTIHFNI